VSDSVIITEPKICDFCIMAGQSTEATVDGKTSSGPWANMCDPHFAINGVGLGTGRGQRLILKENK
jgi:uncharacterized protein YkwD